ncbi:conserved hypothetical protein [groundwater metagenome]|uniref:Methyltransferase small domain-containing protein n=1 Tax=groundwater metagenome TaxID=717931 RepID=A0A098E965_9ZZZZ
MNKMNKMKNLTTVELITHPDVYGPSDDSYLLADILKNYDLEGKDVLDIGTGTGILAIIAAQKCASVSGSDINDKALEIAKKNAALNDAKIEFMKSDLFEGINEKFDLIVFNSPYLPPETQGFSNKILEKSWNDDGTIEKFFEEVDAHLKDDGKFLILLSSLTKISLERYTEKFVMEKVTSKKLFFEEIFVIKGKMKKKNEKTRKN